MQNRMVAGGPSESAVSGRSTFEVCGANAEPRLPTDRGYLTMEKEAVEAVSHSLNLFVFCMFTVRSASGLESPRILPGFSSHWVQG